MDTSSPALVTLQSQISTLTDLHSKIQSLRTIPPLLLRPPPAPLVPPLQEIKDFAQTLKSDGVQEALRAAGESEKGDWKGVGVGGRREIRKRRRPPSPQSPQPYRPLLNDHQMHPSRSLLSTDPSSVPITIKSLPTYIREFNKTHSPASQLHIYLRNPLLRKSDDEMETEDNDLTKMLPNPVVVRYHILDILIAFIRFSYDDHQAPLVVETITAFGPRERKSPHSQSDYMAYQNLSQQLAKTVQEEPGVGVTSIMTLLTQYTTLFTARCTSCHRVLSAEGHVPPVARIWIPELRRVSISDATGGMDEGQKEEGENEKATERGRWDARHVGCLGP